MAAFAAAWVCAHHHVITVVNTSSQGIVVLTVQTGDETLTFKNIPPGGETSQTFTIHGDASFRINGKFDDGKDFVGHEGYVASGFYAVRVRLQVGNGGSIRHSMEKGI
ncbi:MAG: hypothetical protein WC728_03130 [Elusimicrobiota bacterium]